MSLRRAYQNYHCQHQTIQVQRMRAIVYADQPFYPNTRVGSPVVDSLRGTQCKDAPYSRTSTSLQQIGVNVDRWSVRNYATEKSPGPIPLNRTCTASCCRYPLFPLLHSLPIMGLDFNRSV